MPEPYKISKGLTSLVAPIAGLKPLVNNPRRGDIEAVKRSLVRFGQFKPIVVRVHNDAGEEVNEVLMGNHTHLSAKELGGTKLAISFEDEWSDLEAKAAAIADNHTSDLATNDDRAMADFLLEIKEDPTLLDATSYSGDDIEDFLFLLETPEVPGVSAKERKGLYEAAGIRTVVLPFPVKDYERVSRWLDLLRATFDRDTNSEAIYCVLEERFGKESDATPDADTAA